MAQDMLSKVRALIDTADSYEASGQAEPAKAYRAKAEQLMKDYRIDQEQAIARETISVEPIRTSFVVCGRTPYQNNYVRLAYYCAEHVGARIFMQWERNADVKDRYESHVVAYVVGYEMDVQYAEMLYTSAYMVFSDRLEPKVDPSLSDQVNAYRLRSAGIERVRASQMLWGKRDPGKIGRLYLKECDARGEAAALTGRGVTGAVYREQYADSFTQAVQNRLYWARNAADSTGGTITLHGRAERVEQAFYGYYPDLRPDNLPSTDTYKACEDCKPDRMCRKCQTAENKWQKEVDARLRKANSTAGRAGRVSGRDAAAHVELGRRDTARRLDNSTTPSGKEIGS